MVRIGETIRAEDFKKEKHVPVIELVGKFKAGEPLEVAVTVGKEIAHPNTTEHFIAWISLVFKAEGDPNVCELGRTDFAAHGASTKGPNTGPAHTLSTTKFTVTLDKPGTLIAVSYCNIHGLWESSMELKA